MKVIGQQEAEDHMELSTNVAIIAPLILSCAATVCGNGDAASDTPVTTTMTMIRFRRFVMAV